MSEVNEPIKAYEDMAVRWDLLHDLIGGTLKMREAETKWLPKETAEQPQDYKARLGRSVLFNMYADTVETVADRPFAKPLTVTVENGQESELIDSIIANADLCGTNLTQFARELYEDGVTYGIAHFLVDFPATEATKNAATEKAANLRASFTRISPPELIGWRSTITASGEVDLTQIRIREDLVEEEGEFGEETITRVRVVRPNEQIIYTDNGDGGFIAGDPTARSLGKVGLVTIYFRREGYMFARPPLENLAWINLLHWQSLSDQRNILRVARCAILFGKGFSDEENKFVIGPNNTVLTRNSEADLRYVEYSADGAIQAGETDLEKLESRAQVLGLAPFIETTADTTATAVTHSEGSKQSKARAWDRALETGLKEGIALAHEWQKLTPPEVTIRLFNDYAVIFGAERDIKALLDLRKEGEISRETLFHELKRRGVLDENLDLEEEAANLADETMDRLKLEIKAQREMDALDNDGE